MKLRRIINSSEKFHYEILFFKDEIFLICNFSLFHYFEYLYNYQHREYFRNISIIYKRCILKIIKYFLIKTEKYVPIELFLALPVSIRINCLYTNDV